jgi:hypothetical protein
MPSGRVRAVAAAVICALAIGVWWNRMPGDERAIRAQLEALRTEINATAGAGLETAARAHRIGSFFTEDAVVELGSGAPPIVGRATVQGMTSRLQPRTAAFRLELDDIGVDVKPGATSADATMTASFVLRKPAGEESREAREFALALTRAANGWQIARVTAIDTLR